MRKVDAEAAFVFPNVIPPVASVYRMVNLAGLAGGHEAHFHPTTLEICYVLKGRLDWWIGESSFEVQSGDVMVMLPGVPHGSLDSTLQPCEYFAVHLNPHELFPDALPALREFGFGGHHPGRPETGDIVRQIFIEHQSKQAFGITTIHALVNLLIVSLARDGAAVHNLKAENNLVHRAIHLLQKENGPSKSIEEVADQLRVSTVWLTRVFRKELGQSPGEWVRTQKITEAKRLLVQTRESITEIAIQLGFTSSQYFGTAFRRETGLTPTSYRIRCKDNHAIRVRSKVVSSPVA